MQRAWAGSFQNKGSESLELLIAWAIQGDYVAEAAKAAGELYGYGHTKVLFKPTKAGVHLKSLLHRLFLNDAFLPESKNPEVRVEGLNMTENRFSEALHGKFGKSGGSTSLSK